MADKTYDAIVVGGGHHGTIIACYFSMPGCRRSYLKGSMNWAAELVVKPFHYPGFLQNPCAHFTRFYGHPAYEISS